MPKFKVGDQVQQTGSLVPEYMRKGRVVSVIPSATGDQMFTEYEVEFKEVTGIFYEHQLAPFGD